MLWTATILSEPSFAGQLSTRELTKNEDFDVVSLMVFSNGRTGGISHPSPEAQEAVIRQAYHNAGDIDPNLTGYFECVCCDYVLTTDRITKSVFYSMAQALLSGTRWKFPQ